MCDFKYEDDVFVFELKGNLAADYSPIHLNFQKKLN